MKYFSLLLVAAAAAASNEGRQQPAAGATLRRTAKDPAGAPSRNLAKKDSDSADDGGAVNSDAFGGDGQLCFSYLEDCDCGKYNYSPCCTGHGEKCMPGLTCVKGPPPPPPHGGAQPKAAGDVEVLPAGDYSSPSGTCVRCGEYENDPCCQGHKCDIGKMLTCGFNGYCESCGGEPREYCYSYTGEEAGCDRGGEVDASGGYCCYTIIEPCCDGQCEPGFRDLPNNNQHPVAKYFQGGSPQAALVCTKSDECQFCGHQPGAQCCEAPGVACAPGLTCEGGECIPCGGKPEYYCCNAEREDELHPTECAGGKELDANGCYESFEPCCDGECEKGTFPSPYKSYGGQAQDVGSTGKPGYYTPELPLVCTIDRECHFCGAVYEQCCASPNDPCEHGAVCQGNVCVPCGGPPSYGSKVQADSQGPGTHVELEPCCDSPMPCQTGHYGHDNEPLVCSVNNKCEYCGRADHACCDGMKCDNSEMFQPHDPKGAGYVYEPPPPLVCTACGICEECGEVDHPCCQGTTPAAQCPGGGSCNGYGYCDDSIRETITFYYDLADGAATPDQSFGFYGGNQISYQSVLMYSDQAKTNQIGRI